ncbi:hypothetical protein, partial [uncultured Microbacterium sp.]|uniref:hypothetical protein n=1 Tax=uncultured Microbacterium sp. TaxID=191216 RepID=UPI0025DE76CB
MHALQEAAHIRQTSLISACGMHMSKHIWHIAMHASSIDIMTAGVIPCIRSIVRIMVLHMSAQFMHDGAQSIICVEQIVQACSQAEHASMQACMSDMSIVMSSAIMPFIESIIIESIRGSFVPRTAGEGPSDASVIRRTASVDGAGGRPAPPGAPASDRAATANPAAERRRSRARRGDEKGRPVGRPFLSKKTTRMQKGHPSLGGLSGKGSPAV